MANYFSFLTEPIFYLTPDPARAVGLENVLSNYHIVCLDESPLVDLLIARGVKVFSLEKKLGEKNVLFRNTGKLLEHPLVQEYIEKNSPTRPSILYFKPAKKIDLICQKKGWRSLGNRAELNQRFEDKISFYRLCQSWGLPVPAGEIRILSQGRWKELTSRLGKKLVIQFGHGWAGNTTWFAQKKTDLEALKRKFPQKELRITRFLEGKTVLNNACVTKRRILVSPPALQISGPSGFTRNPAATCGRQWPAPLQEKITKKIEEYSRRVGEKMREEGYKGYFGLDFLIENQTNKVYLSENNARLTASVPLYTKMELQAQKIPFLAYHIFEFMEKEYQPEELSKAKGVRGGELIIRNSQSKSVSVSQHFAPGVYVFKDNHLSWLKPGYSLEDLAGEDQFLIVAAGKGRIITPENEIARLNSLKEILTKEGKVKDWARNALLEAKRRLELKADGHS